MQGILLMEDLFNLTCIGLKTQTRRTGAFDKVINKDRQNWERMPYTDPAQPFIFQDKSGAQLSIHPRYDTGDIVYLKEPCLLYQDAFDPAKDRYIYKYDRMKNHPQRESVDWYNKMFMPRDAARYFIKILRVRCELLQNLQYNPGGIHAEGIDRLSGYDPKDILGSLRKIYAQTGKGGAAAWDNNSMVFVYDYELTQNPDAA